MSERLMPGIEQVGVQGQPDVSWYEAHAYFQPALQTSAA